MNKNIPLTGFSIEERIDAAEKESKKRILKLPSLRFPLNNLG